MLAYFYLSYDIKLKCHINPFVSSLINSKHQNNKFLFALEKMKRADSIS